MCPKAKIRVSSLYHPLSMSKEKYNYKCESGFSEELHDFYSSANIIRVIKLRRWSRYVACIGKRNVATRFLVGKPVRKRPLGIPRRRYTDI
jgi:hypothetical protein